MEELGGASLNVDITKFMGRDMEENIKVLRVERQRNELLLLKMLEEGLHADIILTAQGGFVKAHRCVLSAVSPVFKAMFHHNMKEQLSSTVDIPDMTIEGLQLFLLVLYTINEHITIDDVCIADEVPWLFCAGIDKYYDELIRALLKYQAFKGHLQFRLLVYVLEINLSPNNCWEYYDILLQFNDDNISSIVREYIIENLQTILQSAEFLSEMRRNPDRVCSILNDGISSISEKAVRNHIKSLFKKACGD